MLNLVARLMISRSLDCGRPPPAWVARRLARSAELRRFAARVGRMDRAFAATPPPVEAPPPFLADRIRAALDQPAHRAAAGVPWRALAGALTGAAALATLLLVIDARRAPAPGPAVGDSRVAISGFGRLLQSGTPAGIAARVEGPLVREAEELWAGTAQAARITLARLPSPPTRPR